MCDSAHTLTKGNKTKWTSATFVLTPTLNVLLPAVWCFSRRAVGGPGSWTWWSTSAGGTPAPRTPYTRLEMAGQGLKGTQTTVTSMERRAKAESELRTTFLNGCQVGLISILSDRQLIEYLSYACPQSHPSSSRMLHNSLSYMICGDYQRVQFITLGQQQWPLEGYKRKGWCWPSGRKVAFLRNKKQLTNSPSFQLLGCPSPSFPYLWRWCH